MSSIAQILCVFCISLTGPPYPQLSREVWDIRYTHEVLSHRTHVLRLSTDYWLFDKERSADKRMSAFATTFASKTCPRRFAFEHRRTALPPARPGLAKTFIFRCR